MRGIIKNIKTEEGKNSTNRFQRKMATVRIMTGAVAALQTRSSMFCQAVHAVVGIGSQSLGLPLLHAPSVAIMAVMVVRKHFAPYGGYVHVIGIQGSRPIPLPAQAAFRIVGRGFLEDFCIRHCRQEIDL